MTRLFAAYLIAIILLTLTGRQPLLSQRSINMVPGNSILIMYRSAWNNRGRYEFVEILGNIVMFFPLGFCLRKYRMWHYSSLLLLSLLFTTGIELIQYVRNIGIFELDDFLNNLLGTMLGANFHEMTDRIKKADNWKEGLRSIAFRDTFAAWIVLVLCLFALSQYIRFMINNGWLK